MKWFVRVIAFTLLSGVLSVDPKPNPDWWKHAIFYQVYPRSFKDADNDGVGDLKGITSKMEHFKDTGITGIWLSPIYKSPQIDQGYDISNYEMIDQDYGNFDDFNKLIDRAHELGIKVIMDFIPNHTSDMHEWFQKSCNNDEEYANYYVWRKGLNDNKNPPNNWNSVFNGPAWEYNEKRDMWYLHQFTKQQPDLNFRSPQLKTALKNVLQFWLDKKVDGFRFDATPYLVENAEFLNEPFSGVIVPPDDYNYLKHIHTFDLQDSFDLIYEFRQFLDEYNKNHQDKDPVIMMTEAYSSAQNITKWYGDGDKLGAHFTFNFYYLGELSAHRENHGEVISRAVNNWMEMLPKKYTSNWVLGNHDNARVATLFGEKNADGYNMLNLLLPGIGVTYNGEEIGQENGEINFNEAQDPKACNLSPEDFPKIDRDFERTPFQWDNTVNAGFNVGAKPWLPVSYRYHDSNLKDQIKVPNSHYNVYKNLTALRKQIQFSDGGLTITSLTKDVVAFSRSYTGSHTYFVIFNTASQSSSVTLKSFEGVTQYLEVVLPSGVSKREIGDLIPSKDVYLQPHESIVTKSTNRKLNNNGSSSFGNTFTCMLLIVHFIVLFNL